ncbi:MAG: DUF1287 domain-containing protein [Luteolibacter sp.]
MRILILAGLAVLPVRAEEGGKLVAAARQQIGVTKLYDPGYSSLEYPNGDVPMERGVCTDVLIRAMRSGFSMDLQQLVHEDMKGHFSEYPQDWGLRKPDRNIDHRRVPNLQTWFKRKGWALEVSKDAKNYLPGDVVTCTVPPNLPHVMIVSDRKSESGVPLVIHNIGGGTVEEDRLFDFPLTGHYRVKEK